MKELEIEIKNEQGLHARPSSKFVNLANEYKATIQIKSNDDIVNGKSIMGLMLLGAAKGRKLLLIADGEDEEELIEALRILVEVEKFDEI